MSTAEGKTSVAQSSERGISATNARGDVEKFCPNPDCTLALCLKSEDECGFNGESSSPPPVTGVTLQKELPMATMF
jgi:hypothetical protein